MNIFILPINVENFKMSSESETKVILFNIKYTLFLDFLEFLMFRLLGQSTYAALTFSLVCGFSFHISLWKSCIFIYFFDLSGISVERSFESYQFFINKSIATGSRIVSFDIYGSHGWTSFQKNLFLKFIQKCHFWHVKN